MSWKKLPKQARYALITLGVIIVLSLGFTYDWT